MQFATHSTIPPIDAPVRYALPVSIVAAAKVIGDPIKATANMAATKLQITEIAILAILKAL
jgi:hypothetical protein